MSSAPWLCRLCPILCSQLSFLFLSKWLTALLCPVPHLGPGSVPAVIWGDFAWCPLAFTILCSKKKKNREWKQFLSHEKQLEEGKNNLSAAIELLAAVPASSVCHFLCYFFHVLPYQYSYKALICICRQKPDDEDSFEGKPSQDNLGRRDWFILCTASSSQRPFPETLLRGLGTVRAIPSTLPVHNKCYNHQLWNTFLAP